MQINKQVTVREAELLRAICDTLDCPLPPLVVGDAEGQSQIKTIEKAREANVTGYVTRR